MKVKYVSKKKLYPAFGYAKFKNENIYIRKDLPEIVKRFLYWHESFHIKDYKRLKKKGKQDSILWAEIKANVYGFIKQPLGFFVTLILSLSPARLKMYLKYKGSKKGIDDQMD